MPVGRPRGREKKKEGQAPRGDEDSHPFLRENINRLYYILTTRETARRTDVRGRCALRSARFENPLRAVVPRRGARGAVFRGNPVPHGTDGRWPDRARRFGEGRGGRGGPRPPPG